jgi:hypothetical protein
MMTGRDPGNNIAEEQSQTEEASRVELKLPSQEMLVQQSATREFLADEESDPPLLSWSLLLG